MAAHGSQVAMKKKRVMRKRPVGRRGRMIVWKASSATPTQQMIPAIRARKCKVEVLQDRYLSASAVNHTRAVAFSTRLCVTEMVTHGITRIVCELF